MDLDVFKQLDAQTIIDLVQTRGPHICVFPLNGTRRWFILEYGEEIANLSEAERAEALVARTGEQVRRVTQLVFDHGIHTLVMPVFGGELATRGAAYRKMAEAGLRLLTQPNFRAFYAALGIRVRFYGDFRQHFQDFPDLLDAFDATEAATADCAAHRLLYGVCGESATYTITQHAAELGRALTHDEAVVAFYGEPLPDADLFIGFDAPTAFDMPLIDRGDVALYFTVAPSPYSDADTFREILYDWLYVRPDTVDYASLPPTAWEHMQDYYHIHRHTVIGTGVRRDGIWYPRHIAEPPEQAT